MMAMLQPVMRAQVTATAPAVAGADSPERFDIYGGAAYSHFNPGYAHHVQAINLLGWDGSVTGWFRNAYGLEATARGVYGQFTIPPNSYAVTGKSNMSEHIFLFGPSFRMLRAEKYTAGMHVLIGGAYGSFDKGYAGSGVQPFATGVYNNQLAFAAAVGGWADYHLTPKFAVRAVADYQPTRYGGTMQNEFLGTVGIVYKIGTRTGK